MVFPSCGARQPQHVCARGTSVSKGAGGFLSPQVVRRVSFASEGAGVLSLKWPLEPLRDSQRGDPDIFIPCLEMVWSQRAKFKFKGDLCLGDEDKSKDADGRYH